MRHHAMREAAPDIRIFNIRVRAASDASVRAALFCDGPRLNESGAFMSDPGQPGTGPTNEFAAGGQPIPIREPQRRAARISAWGKFSQFLLGIGLGTLPLPVAILSSNFTIVLVLYFALLVLSFVLMARGTYRFVGFGVLAALVADPVIVVQACFVSLRGPQGYLPPAPPLHTHIAPILIDSFRRR